MAKNMKLYSLQSWTAQNITVQKGEVIRFPELLLPKIELLGQNNKDGEFTPYFKETTEPHKYSLVVDEKLEVQMTGEAEDFSEDEEVVPKVITRTQRTRATKAAPAAT